MSKIELEVSGLMPSSPSINAYAIILIEKYGNRTLPMLIGVSEAQSIAIALEKISYPRPLTHDLFIQLIKEIDIRIVEILIYKYDEGIFYAYLVIEFNGQLKRIDARPSDCIAIALRVNVPIFVYEHILDEVGNIFENKYEIHKKESDIDENESNYDITQDFSLEKLIDLDPQFIKKRLEILTIEDLKILLDKCVEGELYELASLIRDEIKKREQK
jgi:bifunctional DNase/RNase